MYNITLTPHLYNKLLLLGIIKTVGTEKYYEHDGLKIKVIIKSENKCEAVHV